MRQGPQHVTADYEIKDARNERKVFGVALVKPDRDIGERRLSACLVQHRGSEINPCDTMPTNRQLEAEKSRAAADIERVEPASASRDQAKDTIPCRALVDRPDPGTNIAAEDR